MTSIPATVRPLPQDDSLFGRVILVIEDHRDSAEWLATSLRFSGAKAFIVGNLKDAERQIEAYRPDLIVCDVRLPDGSGTEFVHWLRRRDKRHGGTVPVIGVTAYDVEVHRAGFDAFMRKPIDLATLCNMAAQLLRLRR